MAKDKKGFAEGMRAVFSPSNAATETSVPVAGSAVPEQTTKSTQMGLSEEYDRETFIVRIDIMDQIKDIAYWDRQLLKETVEVALLSHIKAWQEKNGELKSRPDEVRARESRRSSSGRKKGSGNK